MSATALHDWLLVAPWWHWPRNADPEPRRQTAPALQKYDGADLVNTFLRDPQLRLAFLRDTDEVVTYGSDGETFNPFTPPSRTLTGRRKLYLTSHSRHYLVTCSLHCDAPGFPRVDREQVCEAGFVVRRRGLTTEGVNLRDARAHVRRVNASRRITADVERQLAAARSNAASAGKGASVKVAALEARHRNAVKNLQQYTGDLRAWANEQGVRRNLQGWVPRAVARDGAIVAADRCPGPDSPAPLAGVGRWEAVDEVPDVITEATFPLHPLIVDDTSSHDGSRQTIWFGLVPTGSADVDLLSDARFDDHSVYEIRCFVRRHDPRCPKGAGCDCKGDVVWSEPTEPFQLASHFDPRGTANKPVTVQLPDMKALQAEAGKPIGGVRFRQPSQSIPGLDLDGLMGVGGGQICSFSIPLITIVAMFVFNIFLPIVLFIFQLWFLLLLKFCILPELGIVAGLDLALAAIPPSFEVDAQFEIDFQLDTGFDFQATIDAGINAAAGAFTHGVTMGLIDKPPSEKLKEASPKDRLRFAKAAIAAGLDKTPDVSVPDRIFAPRVTREEVFAS